MSTALVPFNRHVLAMRDECERAERIAFDLCAAAGNDPAMPVFVAIGQPRRPMWRLFVRQAWGLVNIRAGRPASL